MSASISLPPTAAPAAQIALSVAGAADGASAASADTAGEGSFAALFQQLAGKQLSTNITDGKALLPADVAAAVATARETEAGDALTALLPFLEAMGLVQADTPDAASELLEAKLADVDDDVDASLLAGIAPALTPQLAAASAISAAEAAKGNQAALPAPPLAETQPDLALPTSTLAAATEEAARQRTPQVNEFSSRLAAALETAGDKSANNTTTTNPAGLTAQQPAPAAAVPALPVPQRVGAAGWSHEVGNHVVWMANRQHSHAELVMTPPQMGRVEVSLSITGDQASASFVSANPAVRDALEAALPRLREVLAEAGIQLSQTQVGAENSRQAAQEEKNGDNFGSGRDSNPGTGRPVAATETQPVSGGLKIGRGLVDVFA